jgi:hypothetical protein
MSTHAKILALSIWGDFFQKVLFPLLGDLHAQSTALYIKMQSQPIDAPSEFSLGATGKMLVHHSRDSQEKLWSDTCAQALRLATKLYTLTSGAAGTATGATLLVEAILASIPDFLSDVWIRYLSILEQFASHPSAEVCNVTLESLSDLFCLTLPKVSEALRNRCWPDLWKTARDFVTHAAHFSSADNRVKQVQMLESVFTTLVPFFSEARDDFAFFFHLLPGLYYTGVEPLVLKSLLVFFEPPALDLVPPALYGELLLALVQLLEASISGAQAVPNAAHLPFLTAVLQLLGSAPIFSAASLTIQAVTLPQIIPVLAKILETKFHPDPAGAGGLRSPLWQEGARTLLWILEHHAQALASVDRSWDALLSLFEGFLFPRVAEDMRYEEAVDEVAYTIRMVELLSFTLLPLTPAAMLDRLLEIVRTGATFFEASEPLAAACYRCLFRICTVEDLGLAHHVINTLLAHCRGVLTHFIAATQLTLTIPVPRHKIQEVLLILTNLRDLQLSHDVELLSPNHPLSFALRRSSRRHLFVLMSILSQCNSVEPSSPTSSP